MVFFNFLNFFAISLEFFITSRVGIDRNDNFYLLYFLSFPYFVLAWKEGIMVFFNFFEIFLLFFSNSLVRVGWELIGTIIFIFSLSWPFPTCFGFKRSPYGVLYLFNFFAIFFEFFITCREGIDRNDNFYFLSFLTFLTLFCLEQKP